MIYQHLDLILYLLELCMTEFWIVKFTVPLFVGDRSKWLITTFNDINNGGTAVNDNNPRTISASSSSSTSCMDIFFSLKKKKKEIF